MTPVVDVLFLQIGGEKNVARFNCSPQDYPFTLPFQLLQYKQIVSHKKYYDFHVCIQQTMLLFYLTFSVITVQTHNDSQKILCVTIVQPTKIL